jgi:hypothetical protein
MINCTFHRFLQLKWPTKIGPDLRNERKMLFLQGAELFFSAAEHFAQSGRIILKGLGNTIIAL